MRDSLLCLKVVLLKKAINEYGRSVMTRNNHLVPLRELTYVVEPIIQGESCQLRVSYSVIDKSTKNELD